MEILRCDASAAAARIEPLADLLIDTVAGGASIGFLPPLDRERARAFWQDVVAGVAEGSRILLVAERDGRVLGTAQLALAGLPNGAHRAEVQKVIVHGAARRGGIARRLMRSLETIATDAGRTLLVLDTVPGSAAEPLYRALGYTAVGVIPSYALVPGGTCDTMVFYKHLA